MHGQSCTFCNRRTPFIALMNWSQEKFTNLLSSLGGGPFLPFQSTLYVLCFFLNFSSYALLFLVILEIIQFVKIEKNMYVTPKDLVDGEGGRGGFSLSLDSCVAVSVQIQIVPIITLDYLQALTPTYPHNPLKTWYFRQDFN